MHVFFAGLGILLAGVCVLCRFLLELPGWLKRRRGAWGPEQAFRPSVTDSTISNRKHFIMSHDHGPRGHWQHTSLRANQDSESSSNSLITVECITIIVLSHYYPMEKTTMCMKQPWAFKTWERKPTDRCVCSSNVKSKQKTAVVQREPGNQSGCHQSEADRRQGHIASSTQRVEVQLTWPKTPMIHTVLLYADCYPLVVTRIVLGLNVLIDSHYHGWLVPRTWVFPIKGNEW